MWRKIHQSHSWFLSKIAKNKKNLSNAFQVEKTTDANLDFCTQQNYPP